MPAKLATQSRVRDAADLRAIALRPKTSVADAALFLRAAAALEPRWAARQEVLAERNSALVAAADLAYPFSSYQETAKHLATDLRRHLLGATWRIHADIPDPPGLTPGAAAVHRALNLNNGKAVAAWTIFRIIAEAKKLLEMPQPGVLIRPHDVVTHQQTPAEPGSDHVRRSAAVAGQSRRN